MPTAPLRSALLLAALLTAPAARADGAPADLYRQSYAAETRGDYSSALDLMERLGPAGGGYVGVLRKGWLHYLAGRHAPSASAYQRAGALEPAAVEPRLGAMLPLMALRRWKDAQKAGEEVLLLSPNDFTATSRLAWIHFSQAQYAEAEAHYRRAVTAYPASAEMRTGLGWTLLKLGRGKEARAAFEQVLAFAPDQLSAREGLGQVP
jgi:tetratricopeptide (TPR) repeat protein